MNDAATSLDRLHDIVEPAAVPWWPPAPGWYFVLAIAAVVVAWMGCQIWRQWRANAYRRAALRELQTVRNSAEIAELLRRTALAVAPRSKIASLSGESWAAWLDSSVSESMPQSVHRLLAGSVYDPDSQSPDVSLFRNYAKTWIERHRPPATLDQEEKSL